MLNYLISNLGCSTRKRVNNPILPERFELSGAGGTSRLRLAYQRSAYLSRRQFSSILNGPLPASRRKSILTTPLIIHKFVHSQPKSCPSCPTPPPQIGVTSLLSGGYMTVKTPKKVVKFSCMICTSRESNAGPIEAAMATMDFTTKPLVLIP
jgi:hypothetical protein